MVRRRGTYCRGVREAAMSDVWQARFGMRFAGRVDSARHIACTAAGVSDPFRRFRMAVSCVSLDPVEIEIRFRSVYLLYERVVSVAV